MTEQIERRTALAAIAAAIVCLLLTAIRSQPPAPREPNSAGAFSAVSAQRILDDLYTGDVLHHIGTENNRLLKEQILDHLRKIGYEPAEQKTMACWEAGGCGHVENILARLEGTDDGKAVLLAVHYDGVGAGPSVSDDGIAVAATLEIARILKAGPPLANDVIFLIDDGEEAFLLGATAFAADHPWAEDVGAVVNLEARGTSGRSYMFETGVDNAWLIDLMKEAVPRPATSSLYYSIYQRLPNDTDFTVFKHYGMNGVNFAFVQNVVHYHTPLDNLAHANPATLQHQGENALAMVTALANANLVDPPSGTASWFDIWGYGIVSWPETWNLPLSILSLFLALLALGLEARRSQLTAGQIWRGVATLPAALVDATILAAIAAWVLLSLGELPSWPAAAWAPKAMFWLIGIGASWLVISVLGRKTSRSAIWLGALLTFAVLATVCSFLLPGATYLFLVPALLGSGTAMVTSFWRAPWLLPLTTFLVVLAAGAAQLVMAWNLWDAMGIPVMPVVTFFVAALAILVLAPLTESVAHARRSFPMATLAAAGAFLVLALVLPPFSAESPRALNFYFVQDATQGEAKLVTRPGKRELPEDLAGAVAWSPERTSLYPWQADQADYHIAAVLTIPVQPPQLEIVDEVATETGRRVQARFWSPRQAARGSVVIPDSDRIESLRLEGWEFDLQTEEVRSRYPDGRQVVRFATMPTAGIGLDLTIRGSEPLEIFVVDYSFDLPTAGDPLIDSRPATMVPIGQGDLTIVHSRTEI